MYLAMNVSRMRKLIGAHVIAAVLVLRTVIPPEDGFPADIKEAIWIEMSRLLLLKVLKEEIAGYREALGSVVISELLSDPWDRFMDLSDVFLVASANLTRLGTNPLVFSNILREHSIEGDPTTWSILRRGIKPGDTTMLLGVAAECMEALGIPKEERMEVEEIAIELYDETFQNLLEL
jgi:hypothetical protein